MNSDDADQNFLAKFESCRISADGFGHREHLRLAYIYLTRHPFELALKKMEAGLKRLLAHLGAPAEKYHRTLTQSWLLAVAHFVRQVGPTADFEEFLQTEGGRLLEKEIMNTHYSRKQLFSEQARHRFVEPDLQQIPRHHA